MEQLSVETALATQTLPFTRSQGRGYGVQCKVIKRNGERCQRYAIHGGYVCHGPHGGSLPAVRLAAHGRNIARANLAITVIEDLLKNAESERIRLSAAKYLIKFAGITPGKIRTAPHGKLRKTERPELGLPLDAQIEAVLGQMKELGE